jgi:hypothetical protein
LFCLYWWNCWPSLFRGYFVFYIGWIVDYLCCQVIVCFVDIGGIVDHHCLEVIVYSITSQQW